MSKLQILTALLLSYLICSCAEENSAQKRIDDTLKPPPFLLKTSPPPTEAPSYFSKISNWLRTFGEPEKKTTILHASLPPDPPSSASFSKPPGGPPSYNSFSGSPNSPPVYNHNSFPGSSIGPSSLHPKRYLGPPSSPLPSNNHLPSKFFPGPTVSSPNNYSPPQTFRPPVSSGQKSHGQPPSHSTQFVNKPHPVKNVRGPFSNNDISSLQAQETSSAHRYLPPNQSSSYNKDCNPCNKEPWIPIAGNYGSNTVIGFVQNGSPNSFKQYGPPTRTNNQYGPPNPNKQYGTPSRPSNQYGAPNSNTQYLSPPSTNNQYGPPSNPNKEYGIPPNPSNQYGAPNFNTQYLSPPNLQYKSPPSLQYGPPADTIKPPSDTYGTPNAGYGPPKPSFLPTPSPIIPNKYEPPSISRPRRPRPNKYGPPPSNFGGDYEPSNGFLPPLSSAPVSSYGPPPSGPPQKPNNYVPSTGPPKQTYSSNNYNPPSSNQLTSYGAPPTPTATAISNTYGLPPNNGFTSPTKHNNQIKFITPTSNNSPQSSYEPPPSGPIQSGQIKITSDEYLPPAQQLPLSTGNDNYDALNVPPISQPSTYNSAVVRPIPFPNMSPSFVAPIRNAQPFKSFTYPSAGDNLPSQGANIPVHTGGGNFGGNVQISQSVPIADFISTIEYPPNVVQSPIIDLIVEDTLENTDNGNQVQSNEHQVNLKDNPIVVDGDEHHQEASDNHASVAVHDTVSSKLKFTPSLLNTIRDTKATPTVTKPQEFRNTSNRTNVQIDPSLQTLLHDENLASIIAKQLLNENNNSAKPFEPSENSQKSSSEVNQNAQATNNALFTHPPIDYSNWNPSVGGLSTGMQPPAPSQTSWISTNNYVSHTTERPKQIQIIVPYTTNNKGGNWHQKDSRKIPSSGSTSLSYNPAISLYGKLPSAEESQWTKYIDHNFQESKTSIAQTASPISNIQDFFKDASVNIDASHSLPFDILKLQKNIDVWTEQEFNKMRYDALSSTTARFAYSKKIPDEYLTTQSISQAASEVTTTAPNNRNSKLFHHDYLASGSVHHSVETRPHNLTDLVNIDSNLVEEASTQKAETTVSWDKIQVSISPLTNERVYVVTPLPWETDSPTLQSAWSYVPKNEIQEINKKLADNANFVFNSPRFAVRPEPASTNKSKEDVHNKIHSVYGDWPDLINSLATTTEGKVASQDASKATVTTHPLLGRMDISENTLDPSTNREGTVQTYTGHSKVVTAVTTSIAKRKTGIEDKKFTTTTRKPPASDKP